MKLDQIIFGLLVFLLPVQLGKHFWPEASYILGLRVDYLAPTIYFTDLLILGILFIKLRASSFKRLFFPVLVLALLLFNAFLAQNQLVAFYKLFKVIEFSLLGFYIASQKHSIRSIQLPLSLAVIYSSLIAIVQFIKQASLGGVFYWLGERNFNSATPGIAQAIINGRLLMRPYATFSHPNALAGFVLVSLILIFSKPNRFKWPVLILGLIIIMISFSRAVWLIGLLVLAISGYRQRANRRLIIFLLVVLGVASLIYFGPQISSREAIDQRVELIKASSLMIKKNPLIGVGLNNFIVQLPSFWSQREALRFLQPVHNIFLLVAAETGLMGLIVFLWFLFLTFRQLLKANQQSLTIALIAILFLGLFDHYWLTLQQPQLLLTIVLGLAWQARKR